MATSPTSSNYQTTPVSIGGTDSNISVSFTGGKTGYDSMNFETGLNGLYATVMGANEIKFSLNTTEDNVNYPGQLSFSLDHLLVTVEDANDSSKKVSIDLNINTGNPDSVVKNN